MPAFPVPNNAPDESENTGSRESLGKVQAHQEGSGHLLRHGSGRIPKEYGIMHGEFPKEWYWLACMILFFLEREVILDTAFGIVSFIFYLMEK